MNPLAPLARLGAVLDPAMIKGTYRALTPFAARLPEGVRALHDLAYGPHPRQRLNLFLPASGAPETLLVYVHGGGFAAGDKGGPGAPFYANWGAFALSQGWAGCALTYRLTPEARWPSGAEDLARAADFLAAGAGGALGPGPVRIVLAAQSAGAIHAADYLVGRAGTVSRAMRGAVLMSGLYDFTRHRRLGFEAAYQGPAPDVQSTLDELAALDLPVMFTVSEFDPLPFQRQAALVVEAGLAIRGGWPRMHWLAGHNHLSPALFIGASGDRLGPLIADFVADRAT